MHHHKRKIVTIILTSALVLSFILLFSSCWIIFNSTSSVPLGLYIKQLGEIARVDFIGFCLPQSYHAVALQRQYLAPSHTCNGATPLLKRIVALPHDHVVFTHAGLVVNNKPILFPIQSRDPAGRPLIHYPYGDYPNTRGYWVLGTNLTYSWDSRYFGPVASQLVIGKYVKLFPL